jgi:hypothetical protein
MPWKPRYTEQEIRAAVEGARSISEALRRMGLRAAGGNYKTLQRHLAYYDVSIDHFEPNWSLRHTRDYRATPLDEILVENSPYHRGHLKRRLYDSGLKERQCELCGQGEMWQGRSMALILDHINGVATDNRIENLQIVCPNCAATLDTHCGRKNRRDVAPRACTYCSQEFIPKFPSQRYCSQICGSHRSGSRAPQPDRRKVARPSYERLLAELETMSFVAVGRMYGVSDNAVRKWIRWYEYRRELELGPEQEDQAA